MYCGWCTSVDVLWLKYSNWCIMVAMCVIDDHMVSWCMVYTCMILLFWLVFVVIDWHWLMYVWMMYAWCIMHWCLDGYGCCNMDWCLCGWCTMVNWCFMVEWIDVCKAILWIDGCKDDVYMADLLWWILIGKGMVYKFSVYIYDT